MTFMSYGFFLIFLPVSLFLYWRVFQQQNSRLIILLGISYIFYYLIGSYFVFLLLALSLVTFFFAQKKWIIPGILLNLSPLIVFKLIDSVNPSGAFLSDGSSILIPLGISYYTFKHVGYLIDVGQHRLEPSHKLFEFLCYSAFFAQIVAGPLSSYDDTGPQLAQSAEKIPRKNISVGLTFITFGLVKKLFIGDAFAVFMSSELPHVDRSSLIWGWGILIIFVLQVYFDFSGYTDIALGIAYLFGIKLPDNFNNPWLSDSPREFWTRWHITLSYWFRFYVFFPFSRSLMRKYGRKHAEKFEYAATFLTMLFIGIWHGFTAGFAIWGLYNGLLLSLQSWGERRLVKIYPRGFKILFFLVSMVFGFSFLVYPDFRSILAFQAGLLGANGLGGLSIDSISFFTIVAALGLILTGRTEASNINWGKSKYAPILVGVLAVLCILHFGNEIISFVYARF